MYPTSNAASGDGSAARTIELFMSGPQVSEREYQRRGHDVVADDWSPLELVVAHVFGLQDREVGRLPASADGEARGVDDVDEVVAGAVVGVAPVDARERTEPV